MKRVKDVERLGRLLRKNRDQKDLTLKKLSQTTGIGEGSLVGLEQGQYQQVNPDKLRKLTRALGINSRDAFELAGLLPDDERLPTIAGLMHLRYRTLPDEAVDEIQNFVEWQLRRHGINDADHEQGNQAAS